jgi:hypothetical protein
LRLNIPYGEFKKNVIKNIWTNKEKDEFCRGNIIKVLHPKLFLSMYVLLIFIFILIFGCAFNKYYAVYIRKKKEVQEEHINNNTSDSDGKLLDHKEILSGDNSNLRINSKKRKFEKENNSDAKELEFI